MLFPQKPSYVFDYHYSRAASGDELGDTLEVEVPLIVGGHCDQRWKNPGTAAPPG